MPKISAATVKEHHEKMYVSLIDAAEVILREVGPDALTAGAVAKQAGIARNSIYRYVNSVDDLRNLVLERYLPQWKEAVAKRVNWETSAQQQILDITLASLEMAKTTGHNWLISVMKNSRRNSGKTETGNNHHSKLNNAVAVGGEKPAIRFANPHERELVAEKFSTQREAYSSEMVADFHVELGMRLTALWREVDLANADINSRINRALLETGMNLLDQGKDFTVVSTAVLNALQGLFPAKA